MSTILLFAFVVSNTFAQTGGRESSKLTERDWPMFGGTALRNMANTTARGITFAFDLDPDINDLVEIEKTKNVKWLQKLGTQTFGSPVVADGKIFIGTNNGKPRNPAVKGDKGILMCFREKDGKFLWQAMHDKLESGRVNDWPHVGIVSTPAVEGNRLWYVSNRCELICADTEGFIDKKNDGVKDEKYTGPHDADIVWRLDLMKELKVYPHCMSSCSPLLFGDMVFVVTGNGVGKDHNTVLSPQAPSFIAVNKRSAKIVWTDNSPTKGNRKIHGQWSSPAFAEVLGHPQVILPGGDGWLYAFEPAQGKLIWKFDVGRNRNSILAVPVVHENKLYIGAGQDPEHDGGVGDLWCIDLVRATRNGPMNPNRNVSPVNNNFNPKAQVNQRSALHWHYGGFAPPAARRKFGRSYIFGRTLSTCAVHKGLVYAAELAGYLHCLDAQTGKQYWRFDTRAPIWSSPYYVNGRILLGNDDEAMYIFPAGKKALGTKDIEVRDMFGKVRSTPAVTNGVLYVATDTRLFALAPRR